MASVVRELGRVEHFFASLDKVAPGGFFLVATYYLSRPIQPSVAQDALEKLKNRHQILQLMLNVSPSGRHSRYVSPPNTPLPVRFEVQENQAPEEVYGRIFAESKAGDFQRSDRLPWLAVLADKGRSLLVGMPHYMSDGRSLNSIGGDLVRYLNGLGKNDKALPLASPLEDQFGGLTWGFKARSIAKGLVQEMWGRKDFPHEKQSETPETRRNCFLKTTLLLPELKNFHQQCRSNGVTLTSGFFSAAVEAAVEVGVLAPNLSSCGGAIDVDARTRAPAGSKLSEHDLGNFVGQASISFSSKPGTLFERAKEVQSSMTSLNHRKLFLGTASWMGFVGRRPNITDSMVRDPKIQGRVQMLNLSNLGRMHLIEAANAEAREASGADPILVDKLSFVGDHSRIGPTLTIYISTIGEQVTIEFSTVVPITSEEKSHRLFDAFMKIVKSCEPPRKSGE